MDARGRIVATEEKAFDPEVRGHNLVLTIDRTIQYIVEKELAKGWPGGMPPAATPW